MEDLHDTIARLARQTPLDITAARNVITLLISAGMSPDDVTRLTSAQTLGAWAIVSTWAAHPQAHTEGA